MRIVNFLAPIAAILMVTSGAAGPEPGALSRALTVPTSGAASGPRLSGDAENGLILSWMERGDNGASLHYSHFESVGWSERRTVVEGREMFVNWADMPMVIPFGGGRLSAHWLEKSGKDVYAYDVVYVQSTDGGDTWSDPIRPHTDGTRTEHGFVSMFAHGDRTGLIWLDARNWVNEARPDDPRATSMTLRAAFIDSEQTVAGEQLVDDIICDCCQTDIAIAASGPVAVYRDRSLDEIRDISVTRFVDGAWQPGVPVANDNWEIHGCPVNGPAIDATGSTVVVTWFTGANQKAMVKTAWSDDSGASFSEPIVVASDGTLGRVGVTLVDSERAVASWLDPGGKVRARIVNSNGELGEVYTVVESAGALAVPQVAFVDDALLFVWTEEKKDKDSLGSAVVPLSVFR